MPNVYGQLHTTFPGKIQTFKTWSNVEQADAEAYVEYLDALANRNTAKARDALSKITNANNKLITAIDINTIADTVVAIENFLNEGIGGAGVREMLAQFTFRGDWNSTTTYSLFNLVRSNGYIYICMQQSSTNKVPVSNPTVWGKVSQGAMVHGMTSFEGTYNPEFEYSANSIVAYNNVWYIAIDDADIGENPEDYTDKWRSLVDFSRESNAVVSADEPDNLRDGGLWFQIV